jgi:hypothetical protein
LAVHRIATRQTWSKLIAELPARRILSSWSATTFLRNPDSAQNPPFEKVMDEYAVIQDLGASDGTMGTFADAADRIIGKHGAS